MDVGDNMKVKLAGLGDQLDEGVRTPRCQVWIMGRLIMLLIKMRKLVKR